MNGIFTLRNEDLGRLGPEEAVAFLSQLLWAEARAFGLPAGLISIPSAVDARDGGIDAEVRDVPNDPGQGIIKAGLNCYQIKTGELTLNRAGIKSILCKPRSNALKPRIQSCLDQGGRLVIVLFGSDVPDREENKAVNDIRAKLAAIDPAYADARVEVFRQNNLVSFTQQYPSLVLQLRHIPGLSCQTRKSWADNDDMRKPFVAGASFSARAADVQRMLRSDTQAVHVRIIAEPGVGKTRFAFEATAPEDIAPLVVYDRASAFVSGPLLASLLREDNNFQVIAVLDECSEEQRIQLWNWLRHRGPRVKLVTINNEPERKEIGIDYLEPPELSPSEIEQIIRGYVGPQEHVDRWAQLAGNSPRFAHMIGTNLASYPDDILRPVEGIYDRLIAARDDPRSEEVKKRKQVLSHIALFKRFGMRPPYEKEAKAIAALVQAADPQITQVKFNEIVQFFKDQRMLQSETTLYVTPKALHIYMWVQWWEVNEAGFDLDQFLNGLPADTGLREWFLEMFRYAAGSSAAMRTVRRLLGLEGPFRDGSALRSELGSSFFLSLTEADPKSALRALQETIGRWTKEELQGFTIGRRNIIWALERIAVWKDLFSGAARLLLSLAEAENETFANNASGVFADLFSPAFGRVAPTEASPEERFPVLKEALDSTSQERQLLGLRGCDTALETGDFIRTVGAEYQGLRRQPTLWTPTTWDEVFAAYRRVWMLLTEKLNVLPPPGQQQVVTILLKRAWGVIRIQNLAAMVVDTLELLAEKEGVDKRVIIKDLIRVEGDPNEEFLPEIRERLTVLKDRLAGSDFSGLMRRFVGMDLWHDRYDEQGNPVSVADEQIQSLAQQATEHPEILDRELSWLVTAEAQNGYQFGYELGKKDPEFSLLPVLLRAQRAATNKPSAFFLGGYLRVFFEKDTNAWEEQMDALAGDDQLRALVPELTWRAGTTDRGAMRVLNLAQHGVIDVTQLKMFCLGGSIRNLSEPVFASWIEFLLHAPDRGAIGIALDLSAFYFLREGHPIPKDLTFALLTHPLLFQNNDRPIDTMEEFYWTKVAQAFVRQYPEEGLELADLMLKSLGVRGSIVDRFHSETLTVLEQIVRSDPIGVWRIVTKYLGPPIDTRAYKIKNWLQGGEFEEGEGVLAMVPLDEIWQWVDQAIEKRSWYLAGFVPRTLTREQGKICLAREVLIRYGARDDVRRNLIANFSTEGWAGPASLHYEKKKERLLAFRGEEQNENVKRWIDDYVALLDEQIERAKAEEEREEI